MEINECNKKDKIFFLNYLFENSTPIFDKEDIELDDLSILLLAFWATHLDLLINSNFDDRSSVYFTSRRGVVGIKEDDVS